MTQLITTRVSELLGVEYPIVQAPMVLLPSVRGAMPVIAGGGI